MTTRTIVLALAAGLLASALGPACSSSSPGGGGGATSGPTPSLPAPSTAPSPPPGAEVKVTEQDFSFNPATIVISAAQGLAITNNGPSLHNFSIEGTQVTEDTQPRQFTHTEAIGGAVQPGTYRFFCKYHLSMGMEGTITVVPG